MLWTAADFMFTLLNVFLLLEGLIKSLVLIYDSYIGYARYSTLHFEIEHQFRQDVPTTS